MYSNRISEHRVNSKMLAIISPSKNQDFSPCDINSFTQSRQLSHTQELVNILKNKTQRQISKLMSLSDKLSKLNFDRFQAFKTPFSLDNAKQALLAFKGDVYNGINASSLSVKILSLHKRMYAYFRVCMVFLGRSI